MDFAFDTGAEQRPAFIPDHVLDDAPENPTQAQIDAAVIRHCLAEIHRPQTLPTIRRRFVALLPMLADLHQREPEQFDNVMTEFAERTTLG